MNIADIKLSLISLSRYDINLKTGKKRERKRSRGRVKKEKKKEKRKGHSESRLHREEAVPRACALVLGTPLRSRSPSRPCFSFCRNIFIEASEKENRFRVVDKREPGGHRVCLQKFQTSSKKIASEAGFRR